MTAQHYVYQISYDDDPTSPREDDNVGTMVCWHPRYRLGDEQPRISPDDYLRNLACEADPKLETTLEWLEEKGLEVRYHRAIERTLAKHYFFRELYLYDHSGLTMRTSAFSCPWDSGCVGFIYVSRSKARQEYGFKVLTKERERKVYTFLDGEVATYDQFLTGDVYGYQVYALPEGLTASDWQERFASGELDFSDLEERDSCWGFYGRDDAVAEAEASAAYLEEHHIA